VFHHDESNRGRKAQRPRSHEWPPVPGPRSPSARHLALLRVRCRNRAGSQNGSRRWSRTSRTLRSACAVDVS
jgi:hypothetical protein